MTATCAAMWNTAFDVPTAPRDLVLIARVPDDRADALAVAFLEPLQIAFDAGPRKRVVDDDLVALAGQPIGEVAADETRAAGDEDRTGIRFPAHGDQPLEFEFRAGLVDVIVAQSALRPIRRAPRVLSSKFFSARKPRTSRRLAAVAEAMADVADPRTSP